MYEIFATAFIREYGCSKKHNNSIMHTLVASFTKDRVTFFDKHQSNVFVVSDVLRVLEAVVSTHKVVKMSSFVRQRTCNREECQGLGLIVDSCAAGELDAVVVLCR